jgi:hypothetical protein
MRANRHVKGVGRVATLLGFPQKPHGNALRAQPEPNHGKYEA